MAVFKTCEASNLSQFKSFLPGLLSLALAWGNKPRYGSRHRFSELFPVLEALYRNGKTRIIEVSKSFVFFSLSIWISLILYLVSIPWIKFKLLFGLFVLGAEGFRNL